MYKKMKIKPIKKVYKKFKIYLNLNIFKNFEIKFNTQYKSLLNQTGILDANLLEVYLDKMLDFFFFDIYNIFCEEENKSNNDNCININDYINFYKLINDDNLVNINKKLQLYFKYKNLNELFLINKFLKNIYLLLENYIRKSDNDINVDDNNTLVEFENINFIFPLIIYIFKRNFSNIFYIFNMTSMFFLHKFIKKKLKKRNVKSFFCPMLYDYYINKEKVYTINFNYFFLCFIYRKFFFFNNLIYKNYLNLKKKIYFNKNLFFIVLIKILINKIYFLLKFKNKNFFFLIYYFFNKNNIKFKEKVYNFFFLLLGKINFFFLKLQNKYDKKYNNVFFNKIIYNIKMKLIIKKFRKKLIFFDIFKYSLMKNFYYIFFNYFNYFYFYELLDSFFGSYMSFYRYFYFRKRKVLNFRWRIKRNILLENLYI